MKLSSLPVKWGNGYTRRDAVILLILLVVVLVTRVPRLQGPIDLTWDGGVYYILGTSLAEGRGYRLLNELGEIEAIQCPPLLPLIVAAHQKVLGTSDLLIVGPWLRILYFLLSICFTVAVYILIRLYLSPKFALPATIVCILNFYTYYFAETLYAETPFALATVLFVLCNRKGESVKYGIAAGALGAAAYLLRTSGIALLLAWVAESLLRGRYRQSLFRLGVALIPIILWQTHIARVQNSQQFKQPVYENQRAPYQYSNVTYAENISLIDPFKPELGRASTVDVVWRVIRNLTAMPPALGESVSTPANFWKWQLSGLFSLFGSKWTVPQWFLIGSLALLGSLVIAGLVLLWTRGEWFIPLYVLASVLVMSTTPWPEQFHRYFTPMTPYLSLSLFYLVASAAEWFRKKDLGWYSLAGNGLIILLFAIIFCVQVLTMKLSYAYGHRFVTYYDVNGKAIKHPLLFFDFHWEPVNTALEWLRKRGKPGEVIAATAPHAAYLRTGLKAVLPPMEADSERAQHLLDSASVKYVLLDFLGRPGFSERYAAPTIEKHPQLWKLIYTAPDGGAHIYERVQ